jgi:putative ABC transport system permease protein
MNKPKSFYRQEDLQAARISRRLRAKQQKPIRITFPIAPFHLLFHIIIRIGAMLRQFHIASLRRQVRSTTAFVWKILSFMLLLGAYFTHQALLRPKVENLLSKTLGSKRQQQCLKIVLASIDKLDPPKSGTIRKIELIRLSLRNMQVKKTRTYVTIGGITIGIATIVFFVSIGYGLQQVVLSRVVRLEALKQADVSSQIGSKVKVNDKSLSDFTHIPNVTQALPLISVVGEVSYNGSVSDMAVYGVTTDYLKESDIKPFEGTLFNNNKLAVILPAETKNEVVLGASTQVSGQNVGDKIENVQFSITPNQWIRVRSGPSTTAPIIGFTKRSVGQQAGTEVWGDDYSGINGGPAAGNQSLQSIGGKVLGRWIKAPVFIWQQKTCDPQTQGDCEDGQYIVMRDNTNSQIQQTGYFSELNISLVGTDVSKQAVLGVSTSNNQSITNNDGSLEFVTIASLSAQVKTPEIKTVTLSSKAAKQAVVNQAMLKVLGINQSQAIGKTFNVSFVVTGDLLPDPNQKIQSEPASYQIVGVIAGTQTPQFYVPFIDLRSLGVTSYSQVKVVVNDANNLEKARREIEAKGYNTSSVVDTVAQINSVFSLLRTLLALIGFIALAVASLGMLNTLTISLLERTREVGLMKTMGMKSEEIKELFLTESMIMSVSGGVLGIVVGFIIGKLLGVILSFFTIIRGAGIVDVSSVPLSFAIVILLLSLVVGLVTGIYPARRATKISALDALRYE